MDDLTNGEDFQLPVIYKHEELLISGRFMRRGYSYGIFMTIEDQELMFEPDEERNLRAIVPDHNLKPPPPELIAAVGAALEKYLR